MLQSVREDLVSEAVHFALIESDSPSDVNFSSSAATNEQADISLPLLKSAHSECDNHSVRTLDELIEHSHELPPSPSLSTPLPFPTHAVQSPQPSCSTLPSETVHVESSEQKIVDDVMPSQNVTVPSRIIKNRFQSKDKSRTNEFSTEETDKSPTSTKKKSTITSMFDAIMKRKLSPEKEADSTQEDLKMHRLDNVVS